MDQERVDQAEWERWENWRYGVYRSKLDTRTWVPRRHPRSGLTPNLAHRAGKWSFAGLFIVPFGLLLLFVIYTLAK